MSKVDELDTALARYQSDLDDLRIALEEIRDLARTGLIPDVLGMTPEQWNQHKLNKISYLASRAIDEVSR